MSNVIDSLNCGNATSNYFFDNGSKPSEPVWQLENLRTIKRRFFK
jgi:hypothetical protein